MEVKIDTEIFEDLLYISRLSVEEKDKPLIMKQIKGVINDLEVLRSYVDEKEPQGNEISETALRGSEIVKALDTKDLKKNSSEFLDGYFRVPKVLE